ncbi:hypothetical protein SNE40_021671 [Patella caerulea]|uniref:Luciferin 4-monooxygenase n=1 Tax=Patella caerulea TaxID=87958 RepID=A0AAN8G0E9_PATCE
MADIEIPVVSLTEFMFTWFDKFPDNVALVDLETGRSVTYKELKCLIIKASNGLQSLGVKEGDAVCVCSPNSIDYAVVFFALVLFGATMQATNPQYTKDELINQFKQCNTQWVITVPSLLNTIKQSRTKSIKKIIVIGGDSKLDNCIFWDNVISLGEGMDLKKATFDPKKTVACYIFSSGTTGLPKAVMLSHYNIVANMVHVVSFLSLEPGDDSLVFLPFYHMFGLISILCCSLMFGVKLVVMSNFQLLPYLDAIQKYKIKIIHVVPPVMVLLAKAPEVKNYDLTCVRRVLCGAAPLSKDIELKVRDILQIDFITQGYGLSECLNTHVNTPTRHKEGSVGRNYDGIKSKIIDPNTGKTLDVNEDGEVCIKGPQVMMGYLNQPETTAAMIGRDGWVRTGDVGHLDEDGFLYIVDRFKELIKYKGHQVAPAELEALLLKHPAIADVGVIGVPDNEAGELPKAFVVLKKNSKITARDIQNYVQESTAPHKRLRGGVEFLQEIPKSASGKILRRVLKKRTINSKL